jgi:signal transduction histidine kinase
MRERVTELDGTFRCQSGPGKGTHIHVEIPIPA